MRYSRFKKRKTQKRYAYILTIGVLLFGAIYFGLAGAAGNFISGILSNYISDMYPFTPPVEPVDETEPKQDEQESAEPITTQQPQDMLTDSLSIDPFLLSAVQIGAFSNKDNAEIMSLQSQLSGGAGFILHDEFYRVLAAAYTQAAYASDTKLKLNSQGFESRIYTLSYPGASIEITAHSDKVENVKAAFSALQERTASIEGIIRSLEDEQTDAQSAIASITTIKEEFGEKLAILQAYQIPQQNGYVLEGLNELYEKAVEDLDAVVNEGTRQGDLAILSKIRYTYIGMIYDFKQYMERITADKGE